MAGKGKAGKVASKGKNKSNHHLRNSNQGSLGITTGNIRRLARKGGVRRISSNAYQGIKDYADEFLQRVVNDSICYSEAAKRVTVSAMDVVYALKKNGRVLYGYGP